jgi:hypoxanthine phosphoribosyltransferase
MQSYDYAKRQRIDEISWERFATMSAMLVEQLAPQGIDAVIGIARAGLFPATAVACMLRCELCPARITRRLNDQVTYSHPVWKVPISSEVKGKIVAVIDEIADTGETLTLVAQAAKEMGAAHVITASLASHLWASPNPDHVALITDALVIFPWDKQIYADGHWQTHPELEGALKLQNRLDSAG